MLSPAKLLEVAPVAYSSLEIKGGDRDIHLGALATGCPLELAMDGTASLGVNLTEQEPGQLREMFRGFFRPDAAGRPRLQGWNTLTLHDFTYVLRELSRGPKGDWSAVHYDQASELLKQRTGAVKVDRDEKTRAECVGMLAREAGVPALIPGRHEKPVIATLAKGDKAQGSPGRDADTPILRAVASARRAGFRGEVLVEAIAIAGRETGGTYDPTVENLVYPDHSIGYMQINQLAHKGKYGTDRQLKNGDNNMRAAKKLREEAGGWGPWRGANGSWRDGITTAMWKRARAAVEKGIDLGGPDSKSSGAVDRGDIERDEFVVRAKRENSWAAAERLAKDVRASRFAAFNWLVYANDYVLAADPTPYEFDETEDWVDTVTWTVTARERIDEIQIVGRLPVIVPPGLAFAVKDDSLPTYGTWLVRNFKRDMLDPECAIEMSLSRPRPPLPEPRVADRPKSSGASRTVSGADSDAVAKAYAKAKQIAAKKQAYQWAGGHNAAFSGPYDCSGFVSAVLHAAGLLATPMGTGGLIGWGKAGEGKQMTVWVKQTSDPHTSHTFITFNLGNGREIFEAGGGGGPTGRRTSRSFSGFAPRHWQGT